ncbi:toprim domain-containing protein, partial [Paraflavisolibacter sp. H34]|uniref:toprim domain-containing protein n=1 Tax=Huijunlia imazamoxiresistens TaxID=3127457 RepID=UPI00301AE263
LIEQNRALKREMAAMQTGKSYAQIVAAAKNIKDKMPVLDYMTKLASTGALTFEGRKGHEYYFARPDQKTGSISVNTQKNVWFDHSAGVGGDVIKAAKVFENKGFTDAVLLLTRDRELIQTVGDRWRKASQAADGKTFSEEGQKAEITAILDNITHPALVNYLKERGISPETAKGIVKEIHWNVGEKRYFGIGMPNSAGGYALRNPVFKGNIGPGAPAALQGGENPQRIKVFEGFMDFLSYQQMNRSKPPESAIFIVLNSLSNLTKERLEYLAKTAQEKNAWVELYFDNDLSGKEAVRKVAAAMPRILDKSQEYSQFKDLNEALLNKNQEKEAISQPKSRGFRL